MPDGSDRLSGPVEMGVEGNDMILERRTWHPDGTIEQHRQWVRTERRSVTIPVASTAITLAVFVFRRNLLELLQYLLK